jgi:uncharacterized membrane protein YhfC
MTGIAVFLRVLNGVLMVGIPCLAAYFLVRHSKGGFRPIGIGMAGFVLSQVGHIPFNQFLLLPGLERWGIDLAAQGGRSLWVLGIAAGLSAGVFEEGVRYLVFRFWLRRDSGAALPWKYGVGHGGIEAIFTGLLVFYALVQVLALGGEGVLESFPADQVELIRSQIEAYWAVPWHQSLLGAWERISALLFHLGASVFVYKSVREKNLLWLVIALLGHTVLNAFAVIAIQQMSLVLIETLLFVFALLWVGWAWKVRPDDPEEEGLVPPPPKLELNASQISSDQLKESRYD